LNTNTSILKLLKMTNQKIK